MRTLDQLIIAIAIVLGMVWALGAMGAIQDKQTAYRCIQSINK